MFNPNDLNFKRILIPRMFSKTVCYTLNYVFFLIKCKTSLYYIHCNKPLKKKINISKTLWKIIPTVFVRNYLSDKINLAAYDINRFCWDKTQKKKQTKNCLQYNL